MATKKDFIKTADALNRIFTKGGTKLTEDDKMFIISVFVNMFKEDNYRFDEAKFSERVSG